MLAGLLFYLPAYAQLDVETVIVVTERGEITLTLEVARTEDELARGLMYRTELAPKHGMLFLFPTERPVAFWMKDTLIPLDMLFVDSQGRVVKIHHEAQPLDLTSIPSGQPVKAVIELAGGQAKALGITPEARIFAPSFGFPQQD